MNNGKATWTRNELTIFDVAWSGSKTLKSNTALAKTNEMTDYFRILARNKTLPTLRYSHTKTRTLFINRNTTYNGCSVEKKIIQNNFAAAWR